ncbi:MAG: amidohydrolase [Gemmatimonadetes bacterium]|nr:amidohydrolase [Gemmatimonadota bacterium]NNM04909.1 amidohydrolase [Gemmatimonadota bacterium]
MFRANLALIFALGVSLLCTPSVRGQNLEDLKKEVLEEVASPELLKLSQEMVDMIYSFSELGFQEVWTSDYITGVLEREGFSVERGCAGMPTCYVGTWGVGEPVVGFMGDIDGLPETSQKPGVPWQEPLIPLGPGHGEGHNSAAAVDVVAAIATKRVMERHGLQGTLKVIPGVAEELVSSRTYMVLAGLFEDMDVMLSTHISNNMTTGYGISGSGLVSTMFTFTGQSAHSAGSPWSGRSALDAAELMDIGWNFRREHLRLQQRSHSIISHGGNQPNVVPSEATVWYYFRELDYPRIKGLHELGQTMAEAAAMMTGTTVEERPLGSAWPSNMSKPLAEAMFANIQAVGMPDWSDDDQAFAKAVQKMMGRDTVGLRTELQDTLRESNQGMGGGSDDIAEVSWNVPTIRLRYPGNIQGTTGHHWSAGIAMATPIAHKGANQGSRVIALTAMDVLVRDDLVAEAWKYHEEVTTKDYTWESLIPEDTEAPIFLNAEKMERYRPLLEPLKYDPARFDTYLEQLGIVYPVLEKPKDTGVGGRPL